MVTCTSVTSVGCSLQGEEPEEDGRMGALASWGIEKKALLILKV